MSLPFRYGVLDFETTGRNPQTCRVVEVAFVVIDGGAVISEWSQLVNPGVPIPPDATAVHKLTDADVADAPPFADVVPDLFARLLAGEPVLAHNGSRFDVPLLVAELARLGIGRDALDGVVFVDTLPIFRKALPQKPSHTLGAVAAAFDCIPDTHHRATADCRTLAACVEALRDLPPEPKFGPLPPVNAGPLPALADAVADVPSHVVPASAAAPWDAPIVPAGLEPGVPAPANLVDEATAALAQRVNAVQPWIAAASALTCDNDDDEARVLKALDVFKREIKALEKLRGDFTGRVKPMVLAIERTFRENGLRPLEAVVAQLEAVRHPYAVRRANEARERQLQAEREAEQIALAERERQIAALAPVQDAALAAALAGDTEGAATLAATAAAGLDAVNDAAQATYEAGMAAAAAIAPAPVALPGVTVRDKLTWRVEVVAADRVPRHLCTPDLDKIRREIEATGGKAQIDGVFFEVDVVTSSRRRA